MITLVTGANGFVGSALTANLRAHGVPVRSAVRSRNQLKIEADTVEVGSISARTDWSPALKRVSCVVHLAARVHVMNENNPDPLAEFRRVNVAGTINLAQQAAAAGVRRFIYISSIKVNGECTQPGFPFRAQDAPDPKDPYGISKLEAEQALREIAQKTGMEVVIIRPPLVYGPGVKANFESLMRCCFYGVPLPLAAITQNRRSLLALDNLIDIIVICLSHPKAANQTFLVSDGEDISTADLLKRLSLAMGKSNRLFNVPPRILEAGAKFLRKAAVYQRLCESLQVDIRQTQELLNWTPPVSVDESLRRAAEGFIK